MVGIDTDSLSVLSGIFVSVIGAVLVWIALDHLLVEHRQPMTLLLGGGFPLVMGLGTVMGGTWIARSRPSKSELGRILGWWLFGIVVTGLMGVTAILYEQSHGITVVDTYYIVTNNMTAGSAGGLLVGYLYTRSHHRAELLEIEREELAVERERLEVLNRVVRHDIRNDMNVILGWLEPLQAHVDAEGHDAVDRVQSAAEHVVELTSVARDYVEIVVGESEPEVSDVSVPAILRNETRTSQEAYPSATFTIASDLPEVTVRANEMLGSVFRNVLNNAVQHNDTEHPTVEVSMEETDDYVVVSIADNGPGIPDDEKAVVFGKGERDMESPGTGIGMYLVNTLVAEFGGEVWIEDNDPRGAIVNIRLPRSDSLS